METYIMNHFVTNNIPQNNVEMSSVDTIYEKIGKLKVINPKNRIRKMSNQYP